ncbi:MAG: DUF21 domain-containing protein [Clostridia bacterium]|nr:DUF21 domain-containing protein [Clostridia bacterium]
MKKQKIRVKSGHTVNKKFSVSWVFITVILTFMLSVSISAVTSVQMKDMALGISLAVLLFIILFGIFFDILGTAVTAASEVPFHSMASNRVRGAKKTIHMIRNSEKVANVCCDVIGDICGIVSGAVGTLIVSELVLNHGFNLVVTSLAATGIISSLTVGGKALGKTFAITNCNTIVYSVGRVLSVFEKPDKH